MRTSRDFREVQKDLDNILSKIDGTNDPALRRSLLRDMMRLLKEAEHLSQSNDLLPMIQSAARPKPSKDAQ